MFSLEGGGEIMDWTLMPPSEPPGTAGSSFAFAFERDDGSGIVDYVHIPPEEVDAVIAFLSAHKTAGGGGEPDGAPKPGSSTARDRAGVDAPPSADTNEFGEPVGVQKGGVSIPAPTPTDFAIDDPWSQSAGGGTALPSEPEGPLADLQRRWTLVSPPGGEHWMVGPDDIAGNLRKAGYEAVEVMPVWEREDALEDGVFTDAKLREAEALLALEREKVEHLERAIWRARAAAVGIGPADQGARCADIDEILAEAIDSKGETGGGGDDHTGSGDSGAVHREGGGRPGVEGLDGGSGGVGDRERGPDSTPIRSAAQPERGGANSESLKKAIDKILSGEEADRG